MRQRIFLLLILLIVHLSFCPFVPFSKQTHYTKAAPTLSPHPVSFHPAPTLLRCAAEKTLKRLPDKMQKTRPWHCLCRLLPSWVVVAHRAGRKETKAGVFPGLNFSRMSCSTICSIFLSLRKFLSQWKKAIVYTPRTLTY